MQAIYLKPSWRKRSVNRISAEKETVGFPPIALLLRELLECRIMRQSLIGKFRNGEPLLASVQRQVLLKEKSIHLRNLPNQLMVFITACTCSINVGCNAEDPSLEALQKQAKTSAAAGDLDSAVADLSLVLSIKPIASAYFNRGKLLSRQHKKDEALEDLTNAIKLDSTLIDAYILRAFLLEDRGDYKAALRDCDKALELGVDSPTAYAARAVVRVRAKDNAGALRDSEEAVKLKPNDSLVYAPTTQLA